MPRVSVIMPVYNGARFLRDSVESVLAQTFQDFELISVDDGSTDESWTVLQAISDQRVRTFQFPNNVGAAAARNHGVEQADCEYLAFLDADDLANPRRLEIQLGYLHSKPNIAIVASRAAVLYAGAKSRHAVQRIRSNEIAATLLFRNCIVQSSVLMRRSCWQRYRTESEPAEDYDLWVRLAPDHSFLLLSAALVAYRAHESGVSNRLPQKMESAVRKIHRFQLERLGVAPKEEIHRRLSAWPVDATVTDLAEAEEWLLELLAANRIYESHSLERVIGRVWFSICLDSWSLGSQAFHIYRKSRLARLAPSRLWQFIRRFGRRALFADHNSLFSDQ